MTTLKNRSHAGISCLPEGNWPWWRLHDSDGGAFGKVTLSWLNGQLKGNKESARMFEGDKCRLCVDLQWITRKKKID
ncbi:MAG: hypothetical protein JXA73_12430 [Acidobacteria bacterium]|nr:hypothetical protein [Acidobacteriota bacterium]